MELPWALLKMAVAFANIFMAKLKTEILNQSALKPLVWKRFIDDISLWNTTREEIKQFIEQVNKYHQTIKFTAYVSETQTNFLDTTVLDVHTHFTPGH